MQDSLSGLLEIPLEDNQAENIKADEILEGHLSVFSRLIKDYEDPEEEFGVYQLSEEDKTTFIQTNLQLHAELVNRSRDFRTEHQQAPLYTSNVQGKLLELFDRAMNTTEARERGKIAILNDDETFKNPYITAQMYLKSTIQQSVEDGKIQPTILKIVIDTIRGFDHVAKKRLVDIG